MKNLTLVDYLSTLYSLDLRFLTALNQVLKDRNFKKGKLLKQNGKLPMIWYIVSGLAKGSYEDQEGKEHVTRFWQKGQIMLLAGGQPGQTAADTITLLEDCRLTTLSESSIIFLYHTYIEAAKLSSKILLNDRNQGELRAFLCSLPTPQGYVQFQQFFPANRLLLKDIASYLEISPGRLSEIRRYRS